MLNWGFVDTPIAISFSMHEKCYTRNEYLGLYCRMIESSLCRASVAALAVPIDSWSFWQRRRDMIQLWISSRRNWSMILVWLLLFCRSISAICAIGNDSVLACRGSMRRLGLE